MAISLVGSASADAPSGGNPTILLPIATQQDDYVFVFGGHGTSGANAGVSTSGYTEETTTSNTNQQVSFSYKKMGASPDATVTCIGDANADHAVAYVAYVLRGVDTSTPIDATTTTATGASGAPNSPSITTVTNNAAVISFGLSAVDDSITTAPTGYGSKVSTAQSDIVSCTAVGAIKSLATAGAENPAAWTSFDSGEWTAYTVAIRPLVAGSFGDGALSATGTATASFEDGTLKVFAATGTITASFAAAPITSSIFGATGSGSASFEGISLATAGAFALTGTGTASFVGGLAGSGNLSVTGTATASYAGAAICSAPASFTAAASAVFVADEGTLFISHVREEIESRGAVTVNIG